jgi:hypothetical protein
MKQELETARSLPRFASAARARASTAASNESAVGLEDAARVLMP